MSAVILCPWCPGFDPRAQPPGHSHQICPTCYAKMSAVLDALELDTKG